MKHLYQYSAEEHPTKFVWDTDSFSSKENKTSFDVAKGNLKADVDTQLKDLENLINIAAVKEDIDNNHGNEEVITINHGTGKVVLREKIQGANNDEKIIVKNGKLKIKRGWLKKADLKLKDKNEDGDFLDQEDIRKINKEEYRAKEEKEEKEEPKKEENNETNTDVVTTNTDTIDSHEKLRKDYKSAIDALSRGIESMDEQGLARLRKQLEDLRGKISADTVLTEAEKSILTGRIDALIARIEAREKELKSAEKANQALKEAKDALAAINVDDLTLENYRKYEQLLIVAEEAVDKVRGIESLATELPTLEAELQEKKEGIEKVGKAIDEIDTFKKQVEEKAKENAKIQQDLETKMAEIEANMGKTPEELTVSELPELNEGNLDSLQGTAHEYTKYHLSSNILNKEVGVMNSGVQSFDAEFQQFEETKTALNMDTILAGAAVAGVYVLGTSLAAGITAVTGGLGGLAVPAIIGATGWAASKLSTAMGFGESEECQKLREKHESIKLAFSEKAPLLSQKQEALEAHGEKIKAAVSDEGSVSQDAEDMRAKFSEVEQILVDEGVPESLRGEVKTKLEESVKAGIEDPLATLKTTIEDPAKGIDSLTKGNHLSVASLAESYKYIQEDVEVSPPTIMDKTLGAAGKAISWAGDSMGNTLLGGVIDGAGELVSGLGHLIDHPSNLGALIGLDPNTGDYVGWRPLLNGIIATEDFEAGNKWKGTGKAAFNILSIVFGGPKRAFSKVKGAFSKGAVEGAERVAPTTRLGKMKQGFAENWRGKVGKPREFIGKMKNKYKSGKAAEGTPDIAKLESELSRLEGKRFSRFRNKTRRAQLKAEIEAFKKQPTKSVVKNQEVKAPTKNALRKERAETGQEMGKLNGQRNILEQKIKAKAKEVDGYKKSEKAQKNIAVKELENLRSKYETMNKEWGKLDAKQKVLGENIRNYKAPKRTETTKPTEYSLFTKEIGTTGSSRLAAAEEIRVLLDKKPGTWGVSDKGLMIERAQKIFPEESLFVKNMKIGDFHKALKNNIVNLAHVEAEALAKAAEIAKYERISNRVFLGTAMASEDLSDSERGELGEVDEKNLEKEVEEARQLFNNQNSGVNGAPAAGPKQTVKYEIADKQLFEDLRKDQLESFFKTQNPNDEMGIKTDILEYSEQNVEVVIDGVSGKTLTDIWDLKGNGKALAFTLDSKMGQNNKPSLTKIDIRMT